MKKQLIMMILLIMNDDDPDNHDEGSRKCKNVLEFARKAERLKQNLAG